MVPANPFIATAEAVSQAGGVPVLVDADGSDYNLSPRPPRPRSILPRRQGRLRPLRW
jgi:DegT/DnrJ/EryC1/StrS aminotransferase family